MASSRTDTNDDGEHERDRHDGRALTAGDADHEVAPGGAVQ